MDELAATRGVLFAVLLGVAGWAFVASLVWLVSVVVAALL